MVTKLSLNTRTKPMVESQIIMLIAQRTTYKDISRQTGVAVSTVKKIKRRNAYKLQVIERQVTERQIDSISDIQRRALQFIHERLEQDEKGIINLSINELVSISREMHRQTQKYAAK